MRSRRENTEARTASNGLPFRIAASFGLLVGGYALIVRPWFTRWGATRAETEAALPGDEIVENPRATYTRAVEIEASPSEVWPWLVQMGQGRGGLYSYDWLENIVGCNIHSANQIVPHLQTLEAGDEIRLTPQDYAVSLAFEVARLEPERALVLRAPGEPEAAFAQGLPFTSWAFVLEPTHLDTTRLIVRWRAAFQPTTAGFFWNKYGIEPVHFIMERKMLLGIKQRAEALAREHVKQPTAIALKRSTELSTHASATN